MPDTRDELAEWAALLHNRNGCRHIPGGEEECVTLARTILASGVLANLRADAWDEGVRATDTGGDENFLRKNVLPHNPYRNQPGA